MIYRGKKEDAAAWIIFTYPSIVVGAKVVPAGLLTKKPPSLIFYADFGEKEITSIFAAQIKNVL